MNLYRIVQDKARASDLSGTGAYRWGGRWNSKGTYMLYTSETSSLAYLELLAHFDKSLAPPRLFIMQLEIKDPGLIFSLPDTDYPADWKKHGLIANQLLGDKWMNEKKYLGISVRSVVNTLENNYLLNPLFPDYHNQVKIMSVTEADMDLRLVK